MGPLARAPSDRLGPPAPGAALGPRPAPAAADRPAGPVGLPLRTGTSTFPSLLHVRRRARRSGPRVARGWHGRGDPRRAVVGVRRPEDANTHAAANRDGVLAIGPRLAPLP